MKEILDAMHEIRTEIQSLKEYIQNFNQNQYLSLCEAAKFLSISNSKMEKMSAARLIQVYKPSNGKVYFLKKDLIEYINSGKQYSNTNIGEVDDLTSNTI